MKKIETMKLGELKMNPSNPRTISEGQLEKLIVSLLVFPKMLEIRPIVQLDSYPLEEKGNLKEYNTCRNWRFAYQMTHGTK